MRPRLGLRVLSSTRALARALKLPIYHREGVSHVWLVDPDARTAEIPRLDGRSYRLIVTLSGSEPVRADPFDAIEFDLGALWSRWPDLDTET